MDLRPVLLFLEERAIAINDTTSNESAVSSSKGVAAQTFLTALGVGIAASAGQLLVFELIRNKLTRIYMPKTYLVPEREQTKPPAVPPFAWVRSIFQYRDREIMNKCGLDAYFFLRYLQTLLIIFIPLLLLVFPILLPVNYHDGKGSNGAYNVTGLDTLAWGNVAPNKTHRYWAHLVLAIVVISWTCAVFFFELKVYIRVRQDYLTSAQHRLRASATTVLVSSIPPKWLSREALAGLYDVFPGGIRNIWINRNYDSLLEKVRAREVVLKMLEKAETEVVRKCMREHSKKVTAEQKKHNKKAGVHKVTKEEKQEQDKQADTEARLAAQGDGVTSGDPHQVNQTVDGTAADYRNSDDENSPQAKKGGLFNVPIFGQGLAAVGQGLSAVGKIGEDLVGGVKTVANEVDGQIGTTNGFINLSNPPTAPEKDYKTTRDINNRRADLDSDRQGLDGEHMQNTAPRRAFGQSPVLDSPSEGQFVHNRTDSETPIRRGDHQIAQHNFGGDGTMDDLRPDEEHTWWKFWLGPSGGYASPLPHGYENRDDFPLNGNGNQVDGKGKETAPNEHPKTLGGKIKMFFGHLKPKKNAEEIQKDDENSKAVVQKPYNEGYDELDETEQPLWKQYIDEGDRPHHRLARFHWLPSFLPSLPLISPKVDTIIWCRETLAQLNYDIEDGQKHHERYPLMNSAFIQFNHQVAAHMAAQSVTHHIPRQMTPRTVEISPTDVIWGNMSIKWWESWIRFGIVLCIAVGMIILWAIPVAATALLNNLPALVAKYEFLKPLEDNPTTFSAIKSLGGVLPAIVVTILLILPPMIFYKLAELQGCQTGMAKDLAVQNYYFFFSFVQLFLVVSIASGAIKTIGSALTNVTSIPNLLATNLPSAANYFFSYMIVQAFGNSASNLCQWVTLAIWFIFPKLFDNTPREKWKRNTSLSTINWGQFFPFYTTIACIGLIYSIVAPLIIVFVILTFSLFWLSNRYAMLYITKFREDTGGLLYPVAINQTFIGLYFMEVCLIGLFFLVEDEDNRSACIPQAIIMIVMLFLTLIFQYLLNYSFSPLYKFLPITFEDEAVIRDEAFERLQAARWDREHYNDDPDAVEGAEDERVDPNPHNANNGESGRDEDIEMKRLSRSKTNPATRYKRFDPRHAATIGVNWASHGARNIGGGIADPVMEIRKQAAERRRKDLEAQQRIGKALFDYEDEIEDLSPDERSKLVDRAFHHEAIRVPRPVVWIPRDVLGVSDDEVRRTERFSRNIWITNEGTALDSKVRVVYGRNPPDFQPTDQMKL